LVHEARATCLYGFVGLGGVLLMEELPFDHEPSLNHWAKCIADDDIATGYHTNWDYAYEQAWHQLDADYNYNYEYQWW